MKPYIKITLFVFLFIVLGGIFVGLYMFNLRHPDTSKVKPDFIITAPALQKDFEVSEAAASTRYINKILEVNGTILSITRADSTHLNLALKTGSEMSSVICTFALSDSSKFKTGGEITLRGECSGFLMDVLLNNCAVVQSRK